MFQAIILFFFQPRCEHNAPVHFFFVEVFDTAGFTVGGCLIGVELNHVDLAILGLPEGHPMLLVDSIHLIVAIETEIRVRTKYLSHSITFWVEHIPVVLLAAISPAASKNCDASIVENSNCRVFPQNNWVISNDDCPLFVVWAESECFNRSYILGCTKANAVRIEISLHQPTKHIDSAT